MSKAKEGREKRKQERLVRQQERQARQQERAERQRAADLRVYGEDSMAFQSRYPDKSSSSGDARGGVYDISTTNYGEDGNQTKIGDDINHAGIDSLGASQNPVDPADAEGISEGIPEGYEETAVILCENGSPVNGSILFKKD